MNILATGIRMHRAFKIGLMLGIFSVFIQNFASAADVALVNWIKPIIQGQTASFKINGVPVVGSKYGYVAHDRNGLEIQIDSIPVFIDNKSASDIFLKASGACKVVGVVASGRFHIETRQERNPTVPYPSGVQMYRVLVVDELADAVGLPCG
jgi:hypothetical protein